MKTLSDRYAKVYTHKGYDICILKIARPEDGDELDYVIDDDLFKGRHFNMIADAITAINEAESQNAGSDRQ